MHPSPLEECLAKFDEIHSEYHSFCKTEPGRYDTLYDYLKEVLTENELIECSHTLSSCNCCERHTGKPTESCENKCPHECQCLCRHNRRWIYRCLSKYVIGALVSMFEIGSWDDNEKKIVPLADDYYDDEEE